jgi:DNA-binding protein HU-beta
VFVFARDSPGRVAAILSTQLTEAPIDKIWGAAESRRFADGPRDARQADQTQGGFPFVNKIDLAAAVAAKTDMSKTDAVAAIEAMLEVITKALKKGTEVRLVGFGAFYVRNRKASKGRDPRTGETIAIKATKLPKFRPGKSLKEAVN